MVNTGSFYSNNEINGNNSLVHFGVEVIIDFSLKSISNLFEKFKDSFDKL